MQLLYLSCKVLTFFGFWRPIEWNGWKKWLYSIYTAIMLFIYFSTILSQLLELPKLIGNVEKFIHNTLILLSEMNACAKVTNICVMRNKILQCINILMEEPCIPENDKEQKIQKYFDKIIKWNFFVYSGITELTVMIFIFFSSINDAAQRNLVFETYSPFYYNTELFYWTVYIHQLIVVIIASYINISYDILIAECMIQTCAQLEILKYRMDIIIHRIQYNYLHQNHQSLNSNMNEKQMDSIENIIISKNIKHHLQIFKFAELSNGLFSYSIFFQYSVSILVICTSTFNMSYVAPTTLEFWLVISYLTCMLVQIFLLCFHGSNVIYKSIDVCNHIYAMDWLVLDQSTKKSLLIIMTRASRPIKFTGGHHVVLSLESFKKLLELSYSVYNVLRSINHN